MVYKVFATPIILVSSLFLARYKNKRALKGCKGGGAFIYGNHTSYVADAMHPTRIAFPRTADVVVSTDAVSIKCGVGGLVRLLGGVPVPTGLRGLKNFSADIEGAVQRGRWVAVYPEAHIWPYYTGIRPFGAASFKYPAKCNAPVFAFTTTYKRRKLRKKPARIVYIDGPFYASGETLKERAESLRDQVYAAMCARAKMSDCEYCEYCKVADPKLASLLNSTLAAKKPRGRRARAAFRRQADELLAEAEEGADVVSSTNNA